MFPADQPKKRILFVDDERLILDGLQRMLRPCRKDWDMTFVECGEAALAALAANPFDVIVTDMRMPRMDGAQLLAVVKERFPSVIRIVLSGYFERDAALRAAGVAHRYVAKPCEPAKLREAIERCCGLSLYVKDDATIRLLGAIGELPSMPHSCASILKALDDPEVPVKEIGRIVGQDVASTAKVLQLVNSAFFGPPHAITNVQMAVSYLGLDILKTLVLSAGVFQTFRRERHTPGFSFEGFQQHSQLVATIAARLPVPKKLVSTAVVAALLHDTGILVLSSHLASDFDHALSISLEEGRPLHRVEAELTGTTHAEVGAYLLGIWGLPEVIVDAVAHHHSPRTEHSTKPGLEVRAAVYVADILAQEQLLTQSRGYPQAHDNLDMEYLAELGVADEVPAWRAMTAEVCGSPAEAEP
jgi:HD-like signal output (HDOD) protein/CheY-like chemotaxis protein